MPTEKCNQIQALLKGLIDNESYWFSYWLGYMDYMDLSVRYSKKGSQT